MYKEINKQVTPDNIRRHVAKVMTPQAGAERTKEIKQQLIKDSNKNNK